MLITACILVYIYILHYRSDTSVNASFTGSMQLLAGVKLCTGRPITNHPHYEDKHLRQKTKEVHKNFVTNKLLLLYLRCYMHAVFGQRLRMPWYSVEALLYTDKQILIYTYIHIYLNWQTSFSSSFHNSKLLIIKAEISWFTIQREKMHIVLWLHIQAA